MSVPTSFSDQGASVRNLKRLVVALVVSNIALGLFSAYLLRTVDRRYSDLVGRTVPALGNLEDGLANVIRAQRALGSGLSDAPAPKRAAAVDQARATLAKEQSFFRTLIAEPDLADLPAERAALQQAADAYRRVATERLELFAAGKIPEADRVRNENLRSAFDRYLAAIDRAADAVGAAVIRTSDDYTVRTDRLSKIVLGLAGWPLLVFGSLLLLVVILVVAMMIAFRGKDLADAP